MSPVIHRILGEAADDIVPPDHTPGAPPPGRQYPELPPPKLGYTPGQEKEETREVQIGEAILAEIQLGHDLGCGRGWDEHLNKIEELVMELIQMHRPSS